ncbi:uncharacterized protein DUF600 [Haloactinopolyspora alba]|uniref:Uncharacterized protein DUF600 n=1 Tax=Haloactinopolyspora alba TaxID=648780 RepID=A0A2P8EF75_9ACTN|nr:immunity protein YezG family protein [Haloactinopolyspora alba]PSL08129.1 uncharacterized protein DUF600 [Haloactinopolyspora alba]
MSIPDPSLLNAIGQAMVDAAPEGWKILTLDVTAAGNLTDVGLDVQMPDGSEPHVVMAGAGVRTVTELRKAMYEPGKGTWYNATFTVDDTGKITADFDYDTPPLGGMVDDDDPDSGGDADDALMLKDHKIYPRDPENLPGWHPARANSSP